ncbi:hypothetical protein F4777DRAFT_433986 [Nemania sp. FL0916]|nr:hypothetical protein F4777DRAFT_433986 [Nemania sp. FL0916]
MRFPAVGAPPLAICALSILSLARASSIITFSDKDCYGTSTPITVQDTTGSGECTRLTEGYKSFMIGTLGDGCGVTIYGDDPKDPICSATNNTLAETSVCYNSTWTYFSVDECAPSSSSSAPASTSTSTSYTKPYGWATWTKSTIPPTNTPTTTPEAESGGINVGAVVGGVISGVFVVALVAGAAFYFFWFRPKHQKQLAELCGARSPTSASRINDAYSIDAKTDSYVGTPHPHHQPEIYEMSPQYIAEAPEQTHTRHELPP